MILRINNPRRAEIFISGGRHTAEQVRALTGATVVISGGVFNMATMVPCCHLRVRGVDYATDGWKYTGYGWSNDKADLKPVCSKNKVTVDNYICDSWMITEGKPEDMIYDPAQGGKRGNMAIGRMRDGSIIIDAHDDETDRITPEDMQAELCAIGVWDALRLDGGDSVQLNMEGLDLFSTDSKGNRRKCHNYICFWGEVIRLAPDDDEKKEKMSMTEKELRQKVVDTALAWEGRKEADGSFREIIDLYNSNDPLPVGYKVKYTDEWCATFVSAVFIKLGLTDIAPPECGCERMISLHKKLLTWQEADAYIPAPGDILMYDWQDNGKGDCTGWADHVGIVVSVADGVITLIEGNKKNSVKRVTLKVNAKTIRGYCLPDYASKAAALPDEPVSPDSPDTWAAKSCAKGVKKGLVQGDGQGHYGWREPITLQQLMVIMDRNGEL